MSKWNCAIIRNTSNQPIALVVLVQSSVMSDDRQGASVRAMFARTNPFQGLAVILAHQSGTTLNLKGDPNLVGQLGRQDWSRWDWRDVTIS